MAKRLLSLEEARRLSLAAQGFARPRPVKQPSQQAIKQVIKQLGLLQLDFVNVLAPAHQMVLFSRLGAYDRELMHKAVYHSGEFIEHWAHEACIVHKDLWPQLKYRRDEFKPWQASPIMKLEGKDEYLASTLKQAKGQGRITANDLPQMARPNSKPGDWKKSVARWALEYHFGQGDLTVVDRQANFQRVYDLPKNAIPASLYQQSVAKEEAQTQLITHAAGALGVATLKDLADYYRMPAREAAPLVYSLVANGELNEASVEGWQEPAYIKPNTRIPKAVNAASLLSPFDPVVWFRPRAERLFDFHYRIEIYVPAAKRKWGYYVLPFLLNDKIVARLDLKADRKAKTLLVLAAHDEPNIDLEETSAALAKELSALAKWLQLEEISIARKGKLAKPLSAAIKLSNAL